MGIWIAFTIFCVLTQRRNAEDDARIKRLNVVDIKDTIDGEKELILTPEQKEDRLDLKPFQVPQEDFDEMLRLQRQGSGQQIGLEPF